MEKINPAIFSFLNQLQANNQREWFEENKPHFKKLQAEFKGFISALETLLQAHDKIEKSSVFRIYRDIRFSKDKTPYKTNFGASFARQKPALRGGYYLHIEPNHKSFLGVGFWQPNKEDLLRFRKEIAIDAEEFKTIMHQENIQKHWGSLQGEQLKTAPKGFDKNHPAIKILNYKQWIFKKQFTDEEVVAPNFMLSVNEHFIAIRPFFDYMSAVLTTDLNGVSLLDE